MSFKRKSFLIHLISEHEQSSLNLKFRHAKTTRTLKWDKQDLYKVQSKHLMYSKILIENSLSVSAFTIYSPSYCETATTYTLVLTPNHTTIITFAMETTLLKATIKTHQ